MTFENEDVIKMITAFKAEVDALKQENEDLRNTLYRDFLEPASKEYKEWDRGNRLQDFRDAHKDVLTDELCKECADVEGDENFDLTAKIFDDYDSSDKSMDETEYVASVVSSLTEQLNNLKDRLGAEQVTVEATENGDVELKADGETVAEAVEVEQPAIEQPAVEENQSEDNHATELDEFIKSLEAEKENLPRRY